MALTKVKTGLITDGAITAAKIAADAVTAAKIADDVVNSEHLVDGGVDDAHLATGITASKLTGNLPAISGASLTNLPSEITKSTSEPAINTNPSGGVGTLWLRTTTGEMYCCTDATSNANHWTNIGGGSGDIRPWIAATGGSIVTSGNYKIHTFTSSANFVITSGNSSVEYLVVAGGGGGGKSNRGGGGGAGGMRTGTLTGQTAATYAITVGAGGATTNNSWSSTHASGSNSVYSSITSTGGGHGGATSAATGGSGGGAGEDSGGPRSGGAGNTPSVSPSQGNNGGSSHWTSPNGAGGGGGAGVHVEHLDDLRRLVETHAAARCARDRQALALLQRHGSLVEHRTVDEIGPQNDGVRAGVEVEQERHLRQGHLLAAIDLHPRVDVVQREVDRAPTKRRVRAATEALDHVALATPHVRDFDARARPGGIHQSVASGDRARVLQAHPHLVLAAVQLELDGSSVAQLALLFAVHPHPRRSDAALGHGERAGFRIGRGDEQGQEDEGRQQQTHGNSRDGRHRHLVTCRIPARITRQLRTPTSRWDRLGEPILSVCSPNDEPSRVCGASWRRLGSWQHDCVGLPRDHIFDRQGDLVGGGEGQEPKVEVYRRIFVHG